MTHAAFLDLLMLLSEFDFQLPPELIAQNPIEPRDQARLLVYERATGTLSHRIVADLPQLLPPQTLIIANNSKVRHGRLFTTEGREMLLVQSKGNRYEAIMRGKQPRIGDTFRIAHTTSATPLHAEIMAIHSRPGMTTLEVSFSGVSNTEKAIEAYGSAPLPPYIHASTAPAERYQTVYAGPLGSAAAPTAGLHFTPELIKNLREQGHSWEEITLHVGLGTFLPLRHEEITANQLHEEFTNVTPVVADTITHQVRSQDPLLAIGTTSLRTLESHWQDGKLTPGFQSTELFIYPGHHFTTASHLLTNFHLPKSSLLLLVAAFLGCNTDRSPTTCSPEEMRDRLHHIYETAITERYRFFSFGDALLIC